MNEIPAKVAALSALHGSIVTLRTVRDCKVRKGEVAITKDSTFQCRIGVNYDNIAAVKEKREDGTLPETNQGLIGREWIVFPYIQRTLKNNKFLLRCTKLNGNPTKTLFLRAGKEITRLHAEEACLASEFRDGDRPDVFDVTIDNITEINGKAV